LLSTVLFRLIGAWPGGDHEGPSRESGPCVRHLSIATPRILGRPSTRTDDDRCADERVIKRPRGRSARATLPTYSAPLGRVDIRLGLCTVNLCARIAGSSSRTTSAGSSWSFWPSWARLLRSTYFGSSGSGGVRGTAMSESGAKSHPTRATVALLLAARPQAHRLGGDVMRGFAAVVASSIVRGFADTGDVSLGPHRPRLAGVP
jgi:hypothetical protein